MNTLNKLFELIPVENVITLKAEELGRYFLLALEDNSDICSLSIVNLEKLVEAIDKIKLNRYAGPLPRPDSVYDAILFALMEAWQWLLGKAYIAQKPHHTATYHIVKGGPSYFITKLGLAHISEHKRLLENHKPE